MMSGRRGVWVGALFLVLRYRPSRRVFSNRSANNLADVSFQHYENWRKRPSPCDIERVDLYIAHISRPKTCLDKPSEQFERETGAVGARICSRNRRI